MYVRHRNTGTVLVTMYNCGHWHFIAVVPGTWYQVLQIYVSLGYGGGGWLHYWYLVPGTLVPVVHLGKTGLVTYAVPRDFW